MKNLFKNTFPLGKKQPSMNIQKMEKKKIHKPKNQFPQTGIRFPFEKLLPSNFQNFIKALNKRITFPLNRKLLSITRNEEVVKIYIFHLAEKLFSQPGFYQMEETVFRSQENSYYLEQRSFPLKIGFHIVLISTSKTLWIKNILFHRNKKRILQLLFLPVETIIKIRNNSI